jgi:methionyl-tRNA formyltransferase
MKTPLSIAFFGTSAFSVHVLNGMHAHGIVPALIVTQPDRPKGRGQHVAPPPAKEWALEHDIAVVQPERLQVDADGYDVLQNTRFDAYIVASYGLIIPAHTLALPTHGALNVHPSLLPLYRGASPIQSHIMADDRNVGVSIMVMDEQMDHGPILAQGTVALEEWPIAAPLLEHILATEGAALIAEALPLWINGTLTPEPQDHTRATFTRKFAKSDGCLNLDDDAYTNYLKIKAFAGTIGTYFLHTRADGSTMRVKITDASYHHGTLVITRVIPEGKSEMDYTVFQNSIRSLR